MMRKFNIRNKVWQQNIQSCVYVVVYKAGPVKKRLRFENLMTVSNFSLYIVSQQTGQLCKPLHKRMH